MNNKQSTGMKGNRIHSSSNAAVTTYNNYNPTSTINSGMMSVTTQGGQQFIRPNVAVRPMVKNESKDF